MLALFQFLSTRRSFSIVQFHDYHFTNLSTKKISFTPSTFPDYFRPLLSYFFSLYVSDNSPAPSGVITSFNTNFKVEHLTHI